MPLAQLVFAMGAIRLLSTDRLRPSCLSLNFTGLDVFNPPLTEGGTLILGLFVDRRRVQTGLGGHKAFHTYRHEDLIPLRFAGLSASARDLRIPAFSSPSIERVQTSGNGMLPFVACNLQVH